MLLAPADAAALLILALPGQEEAVVPGEAIAPAYQLDGAFLTAGPAAGRLTGMAWLAGAVRFAGTVWLAGVVRFAGTVRLAGTVWLAGMIRLTQTGRFRRGFMASSRDRKSVV